MRKRKSRNESDKLKKRDSHKEIKKCNERGRKREGNNKESLSEK